MPAFLTEEHFGGSELKLSSKIFESSQVKTWTEVLTVFFLF